MWFKMGAATTKTSGLMINFATPVSLKYQRLLFRLSLPGQTIYTEKGLIMFHKLDGCMKG